MSALTLREQREIEQANASGLRPVVFVHGLWLLANSWDNWRGLFEQAGYVTLAPGWPDDPESVSKARDNPAALAGKGLKEIVDHYAGVIRELKIKPVIIGHSFGGLITQILAGQGLGAASVAIDPAPGRGVLPLPYSSVKVASVALRNPANYNRAVGLTFEEFRYGFGNAVSEDEARQLYAAYSVAGPGRPLFQAAIANLNPRSAATADAENPARGPLLLISGTLDHTVPPVVVQAAFRRQQRNAHPTEFRSFPGRGHSLTIDSGWREVADVTLAFVQRSLPGPALQKGTQPTVPPRPETPQGEARQ